MAARPANIKHIPLLVATMVKTSMYGVPGAVYIDMPADIIFSKIAEDELIWEPMIQLLPQLEIPMSYVEKTISMLKNAKRPLAIVGKGIAYAQAEDEIRHFIEKSKIPVLATPMGKGVVADQSEYSVARARTFVL
jgi:2-hydroxyacyl-CoA lyase 1